jgi:hypothetical protein
MSFTDQNSTIPTDSQHDEHFAHRCVDCDTIFSKAVPIAGDCTEGSLCSDCFDARLTDEVEETILHNPENVPPDKIPPGWRLPTVTEFKAAYEKQSNRRFRVWLGIHQEFSQESWDLIGFEHYTYIIEDKTTPTNPFLTLAVYNSAAQYCSDELQGDITFLNFVMNLPHHYLVHPTSYLHTLFTDKHFTP